MQKTIALFTLVILFVAKGITQIMPLTLEPDGGNKKASISEQIGVVKIEIKYNRPGVKGREGQIWGTTVAHYGFKAVSYTHLLIPTQLNIFRINIAKIKYKKSEE